MGEAQAKIQARFSPRRVAHDLQLDSTLDEARFSLPHLVRNLLLNENGRGDILPLLHHFEPVSLSLLQLRLCLGLRLRPRAAPQQQFDHLCGVMTTMTPNCILITSK